MTVGIRHLALFATLAALSVASASAGPFSKKKSEAKLAEKRAAIDSMAADTLKRFHGANPKDESLLDKAWGYAVFDNTKVALGLSGGGGRGVAVEKASGKRTYMRMATGGVGVGLGVQSYQVVFAFETEKAFRRFVDEGWEADAAAQASAGSEGANAESQFRDGMAIWQFTEKGLMASANVSGTKYWENDKLN